MTRVNAASTIGGPSGATETVSMGGGAPLALIAGPCVIESREHCMRIAESVCKIARSAEIPLVFKASFDKANRTSLASFRGVGIEEGLKILCEIRQAFGVPVVSDVHNPEQARLAGRELDIVQIPAFLCRQTDLLCAAGESAHAVMIKKGQFLHPEDMAFARDKVASGGRGQVLLCERGTSFGYRDLVVDFRGLRTLRGLGTPVVFDATHSVQRMGGAGGATSGDRSAVSLLARAAVSVGVDAVFLECHDDPDSAPSDGANMLDLKMLSELVGDLKVLSEIHLVTRSAECA